MASLQRQCQRCFRLFGSRNISRHQKRCAKNSVCHDCGQYVRSIEHHRRGCVQKANRKEANTEKARCTSCGILASQNHRLQCNHDLEKLADHFQLPELSQSLQWLGTTDPLVLGHWNGAGPRLVPVHETWSPSVPSEKEIERACIREPLKFTSARKKRTWTYHVEDQEVAADGVEVVQQILKPWEKKRVRLMNVDINLTEQKQMQKLPDQYSHYIDPYPQLSLNFSSTGDQLDIHYGMTKLLLSLKFISLLTN